MKETVIDVLMYLFESYMDDEIELDPDRQALQVKLLEAGFPHMEIEKAFEWLEELSGLRETQASPLPAPQAIRLYHASETQKLDAECQGFLLFLEQAGVLMPASRELVIDRVMALDAESIDLEQLKWVILMVLFNLPGEEAAYNWFEDMVFEDAPVYLH